MAATLSVSDWKKQIKPYPNASDVGPVTKALEEYAKLGSKGDPDALLDAIDVVIARAKAAKKKNAKEKDLVEVLDDLIGDAEQEQDDVAREAARNPPEDEDDAGGDMLRSMLIRVKKVEQDKALPFVVALGTVPGMVIARRPPLSRDHKNTARAMREGKGKLLMGQCFGEDGKFIFEFPDKPPGGLTKVIKKAAKLHANMDIRLKVRGGGAEIDDEADLAELTDFGSDGDDAQTATAVPPAPPLPPTATAPATDQQAAADDFKSRAREVRVALDELKAVNPGVAATLTTEFATSLGHAQAGRYGQARGLLDTIVSRIHDARRGAGAATQGGAAEVFQGRVNAITPALKEGLQKGGESAQTLKLKFSEANVFSRKQDFARANALLDEVETLLKSSGSPAADSASKKSDASAGFTNRLKDLLPRIKEAQAAGGDAANEVKLKVSEAQVFARKGEFERGNAILKDLEDLLNRMPESATAAAAAGGPERATTAAAAEATEKTNTVSLWVDARDKVISQMNALQDAVIREGADTGDGDFELIAKQGLAAITRRLQVGLHVALLEFDTAPAGKKAGAGAKARAKVNEFKSLLATNPMVRLAEKNPWGVKVEIRSVIAPMLDRLTAELSA